MLRVEQMGPVSYSTSYARLLHRAIMSLNSAIPLPNDLKSQVERALAEDIGSGDLTAALIPRTRQGRATVITREPAVLCGKPYAEATFAALDPQVQLQWHADEGAQILPNDVLLTLVGPARALLTGERTALNFIQLLSATATAARAYTDLVRGTRCRILDTRKTLPGLRTAQKYAVRVGGGHNHRIGLFDGILIKENHIMAAGSIAQAVISARTAGAGVMIEVEVETLDQLRQAIAAHVDVAMLDNFDLERMRQAVALNAAAAEPVKLEASGGVTPSSVRAIAETGVDFVSIGGLTKHVHAVDLSMRFEWQAGNA